MKIFYSDIFPLPLPDGHRFPEKKYAALRGRLERSGLVDEGDLRVAPRAADADLLRVHTADYVRRMSRGEMTAKEMRRVGFPWSPELVERTRRSTGGTLAACRTAVREGISVHLAGGTHHAYPDHGQGFCVWNDCAVAARDLQANGLVQRVLIIDCDVHQGNGTAAVFLDDPGVFTFSIHGEKNFPFRKTAGDLDIGLPDGTGDEVYLAALDDGLDVAFGHRPDFVIYLAGSDPFVGDKLGRLAISKAGLLERDRRVLGRCKAAGLPVGIAMSGGYAPNLDDIVDVHMQTVVEAVRFWKAKG